MQTELPSIGDVVHVRQRTYLVEEVTKEEGTRPSTLVALSCMDDDAAGNVLQVIWEHEHDAKVLRDQGWGQLSNGKFDPPELFAAYLNAVRWNCVTATTSNIFQAPFRAGIKIEPYQIEPLQKALSLPRVNLFIADDVGLGKTIEAALIANELLLRKRVDYILVVCPPSVQQQWKDEFLERFGLKFELLNRDFIRKMRTQRGFGINPWATNSRFIVSQKLLIDEEYAGTLRDFLGDMRQKSMLILDEAHNAAPASSSKYAIDSQFTKAIRGLAPRFEHRLFLSATPHNGHSNSFAALLEILDPQRFCRGVQVKGPKLLDAVMVRRLKEDLRAQGLVFPKRNAEPIIINNLPESAPELELSRMLEEYRKLWTELHSNATGQDSGAAHIVISGLQERLLSCAAAFWHTLKVHIRSVKKQAEKTPEKPISLPEEDPQQTLFEEDDADSDAAEWDDDTRTGALDANIELLTKRAMNSGQSKDVSLQSKAEALRTRMLEIADKARHEPDAKIKALLDWLDKNACPGMLNANNVQKPPKWNDLRVIIFTQYDHTLSYIRNQLLQHVAATDLGDDRIGVYKGSTSQENREALKKAFNAPPSEHPIRILLANDAAREGLNLQAHCWNLFHFDIPWNPSRLEQRNGRIDRKLQPHDEVFCRFFVYAQRPEDRILQALIRKTEIIQSQLGSLTPVIDAKICEALRKKGIERGAVEPLEKRLLSDSFLSAGAQQAVVSELEEASREKAALTAKLESLEDSLEKSRSWIGFRREHFKNTVNQSLRMMGCEHLSAVEKMPSLNCEIFRFPHTQSRIENDASWVPYLDLLRRKRERGEHLWDWRKNAHPRPVTFHEVPILSDSVVQLHLEHPVVQRLLSRLRSQGFQHNDIARACILQTEEKVPRVVLLGRVIVYGKGAARLHEEIVTVSARWKTMETRDDALQPYKEASAKETFLLMEQALADCNAVRVNEKRLKDIGAAAVRDVSELRIFLEKEAKEAATEAIQKLKNRGDAEAKSLRTIIEAQIKRVRDTADTPFSQSLFGDWSPLEIRQFESDKKHWAQRLAKLQSELDTEPSRIAALYEVAHVRTVPLGLVYLVPGEQ